MKQKKSLLLHLILIFTVCIGLFFISTDVQAAAISKTKVTLTVGKSTKLKVSGTTRLIKWKSSKPSVAKVSAKGKVTAVSAGTAKITAKVGKQKLTCKVTVKKASSVKENTDSPYLNALDSDVKKKLYTIISDNIKNGMSDVEKVKAIHDYMILNCAYDYNNYLNRTIPADSYTPRGVLIRKKAVCQGYATTFKTFMDALNIPCQMVTGTANGGGHAWNIVKVNGKWYQIDVTWDDPVPDQKGRLCYTYFLITDKQMAKNHSWVKSGFPACTSDNNQFVTLLGTVSKDEKSLSDNINKIYASSSKTGQIIVPKSLCKGQYDIFNYVHYTCSASSSEYGNYWIVTLTFK